MADAHTTDHGKFDNLNVDEKAIQTINRFLFEVYCYAKEKNIPYLIDKSHRISADLNAQFRRGRNFPGRQKYPPWLAFQQICLILKIYSGVAVGMAFPCILYWPA
jgi:hypothetical protein